MNNLLKLGLAITFLGGLASCSNTESKKEEVKEVGKQECYVAVDGTDTAYLDLNILENGKIDGNLLIKFADKPQNKGIIAGKFSGDTLFVDYSFTLGDAEAPIYKNPLAFLKRDKQMVLGVGQIETTLGKSYFVKGQPINFERGKFTFEPGDCKN
jgi:hypothetical protein